MFDAKSILDALVRGAGQPQGRQPDAGGIGGLEDLLRQLTQGSQSPSAGTPTPTQRQSMPQPPDDVPAPRDAQAPGSGGGLQDILREVLGGGQGAQRGPGGTSDGGGIAEILEKLRQQGGQSGGLGGIGDILGQIFGQAKEGVREGASRFDEASGASDAPAISADR